MPFSLHAFRSCDAYYNRAALCVVVPNGKWQGKLLHSESLFTSLSDFVRHCFGIFFVVVDCRLAVVGDVVTY